MMEARIISFFYESDVVILQENDHGDLKLISTIILDSWM